MNMQRNLVKVAFVAALIIGLIGLIRLPATVQPQAQSGGPAASVVAEVTGPHPGRHNPHPQVNWNA
jgi:hypothetical protein